MRHNCNGISFFLLVLTVVLSNSSVAETTDFLTHSTLGKVYVDENGELRGLKNGGRRAFNVELVREMMLLVKHPVQFQVMPFKRGQIELKKKRKALFNIARTKLREKLYKWVGPLQVDNVYFYESVHQTPLITDFEQAKEVPRICVLRGTSQYENLLAQGFKNVYDVNAWSACLKMLTIDRVDLVPVSDSLIRTMMSQAEVTYEQIRKTSVLVQKNAGYIAFSKDHSDDEIDKWQQALDELKRSGKYDELVHFYLHE
ncbi:substrate-binding periplasmic protein [Vibrio spartinae]|uniref:Bacterial extracellular solute-binding proteins, family 3 n=1 Tax=Vibrio spartinae TaxID=1918945 RepID=A0A1N6M5H2_9VIBR|nr:transporter substrate-binding domain-containing protein [Vibrio spartinae]SIO94630.1 Bacterial extracellular solute-binding proteins, family 3 [Vibrio spartinae]